VLAAITFRSPGGDKHPSLDPVVDGQFRATRLFLRLQVEAPTARVHAWEDGRAIDAGDAWLWLACPGARFGETPARLSHSAETGRVHLDLDLLSAGAERTVRWSEVAGAHVPLLYAMETPRGLFEDFVRRWRAVPFDAAAFTWGDLRLRVASSIGPVAAADRAYAAFIGGEPAPLVRLSEEKLAG
jgi:hypothetical protein